MGSPPRKKLPIGQEMIIPPDVDFQKWLASVAVHCQSDSGAIEKARWYAFQIFLQTGQRVSLHQAMWSLMVARYYWSAN